MKEVCREGERKREGDGIGDQGDMQGKGEKERGRW